jgi:hypothetical protein
VQLDMAAGRREGRLVFNVAISVKALCLSKFNASIYLCLER